MREAAAPAQHRGLRHAREHVAACRGRRARRCLTHERASATVLRTATNTFGRAHTTRTRHATCCRDYTAHPRGAHRTHRIARTPASARRRRRRQRHTQGRRSSSRRRKTRARSRSQTPAPPRGRRGASRSARAASAVPQRWLPRATRGARRPPLRSGREQPRAPPSQACSHTPTAAARLPRRTRVSDVPRVAPATARAHHHRAATRARSA